MAKYECKVCGYIYNEQHASRSFDELTECPICNEGKENFIALDSEGVAEEVKPAEVFFEEKEESTSENESVEVAETLMEEVKEDIVKDIDMESEKVSFETEVPSETPEFVVERRQEFWSPIGNREETIVADEGEKEEVVDSSYGSRIESFYSSAEPVGMAHIISDEEEKEFKPLWNSTGGTVQRVIDPFGDRSEPLVKAENVDMVMPAETPVVEEILGEEPEADDMVAEESAVEAVAEEVFFAEEEEAVTFEPIAEPVTEAVAEESVVEETITEDVIEEVTFTTAADTVAEEAIPEAREEEFVAEENVVAEASEENATNPYFLDEEEDDDFFSEVVMDHFVTDEPILEATVEEVIEEPVAEAIVEEVAEEAIEEPVAETIIEEVTEEVMEESVAEAIAEDVTEEAIEEPVAEVIAEDVTEEAIEEPVAEAIVEDVTEEVMEEPVAEAIVEEVAEEPVAEQAEESPRIKAWSFLDDIIEAGTVVGAGVTGAAVVSELTEEKEEAVEEVAEEAVETMETAKDDSYDFFTEEIRRAREAGGYTPLRVGEIDLHDSYEDDEAEAEVEAVEEVAEEVTEEVEEVVETVVSEEPVAEEKAYCNNLEKILILPAQLNPMPLPEAVEVDGRTVLGIGSERPLVLDNPVFSTGEYNMVQYIPNSGLTSEDYQKADAIEIVVGKGNGIEKNINSKEDLRQVVNFLRLESDGCPIGIKLGAGRIERDLEFCIFAKPDYVVLNNFSVVPLPYALHRAAKFLNTVQSDIDVVIALDGVKDAEELAKIIAMGADVIALRNHPTNLDEMIMELKNHARVTGHYEVQDLNVKDLCTIDREIAEYTDIYHV